MTNFKTTALLAAIVLAGFGCKSTGGAAEAQGSDAPVAVASVPNFETQEFVNAIRGKKSKITLTQGQGVTAGTNAIKVDFEGVSEANKNKMWPNMQVNPASGSWNWEDKDSFTIDVTNPTSKDAFLNFKVVDKEGTKGGGMPRQLNHRVMVPAGATQNVEVVFRANLYSLPGYWGGDDLDLTQVQELKVFIQGPIDPQTLIFDNFKLVDVQQ